MRSRFLYPCRTLRRLKLYPYVEARFGAARTIPDDLIWGRGIGLAGRDELTTVLAPGNYAPMPHGEDDQWISNIGIIDGKLHVQTGKLFGIKSLGAMMLSLLSYDP
jgi:hypothetical protein